MSEAVVFDEKFVIEKKDGKGYTNGTHLLNFSYVTISSDQSRRQE